MTVDISTYVVNDSQFRVPSTYDLHQPIGQGAYGLVCSATCRLTGESVAIKRIERAFEHVLFARRTLRELKILQYLKHENILSVKEVYLSEPSIYFNDIYVVSELMETDLASVLKTNQPIYPDHIQLFTYQILRGLKYIHSANIIHRDLKPRNILVNRNCDLKICDFGLSRVDSSEPLSEYVCTRWYRAPEVLFSWTDYSTAIDLWSVGCILGEMLGKRAMFPGQNSRHQLQVIAKVLGLPTICDFPKLPSERVTKLLQACGPSSSFPTRSTLIDVFPAASDLAVELLGRLLIINHERRLTACEALDHEYLRWLHCEADEPSTVPMAEFCFEGRSTDIKELRDLIFRECN